MILPYLKTVSRQLFKNRSFLLINVTGLAIALAACLVIWQFVAHHLSYDAYLTDADHMYRVSCHVRQGDQEDSHTASLSPLLGPAAAEGLPAVKSYARFWDIGYMNHSLIFKADGEIKMFSEEKVYLTDVRAFDWFELEFIHGSPLRFVGKDKMILSESSAIKYFGTTDPVGKRVELASNMGNHTYQVMGVVKDPPDQSHLAFDLLLSFEAHRNYYENSATWARFNTMNYLEIEEAEHVPEVTKHIQQLLHDNLTSQSNQRGYEYDIYLEPVKDIHLYSSVTDSFRKGTNALLVYALLAITVIVLVIAWINYLNLAMVRAIDRTREIGVRRVFGSSHAQLATLFTLESLMVNGIAFVLALTLAQLGTPYLNELIDFRIDVLAQPGMVFILLLTVVFGALITGLYPMTLLKVLKTADVLTGRKGPVKGKLGLQRLMILIQFAITLILVAATFTIYQQITFMKSADLGINLDDTLIIKSPPSDIHLDEEEGQVAYNRFKSTLQDHSAIVAMTNAGEAPGEPISWKATAVRLKNASENTGINTGLIAMGLNFREFFNIEVLAGRWYREGDSPWRKKDCVINRKLAERLGFVSPEEAIGAEIAGFFAPIEVRGVVENYHHESLHADYEPVIYVLSDWTEYYFIKLNIDPNRTPQQQLVQLRSGITTVQQAWDDAFVTPMDYSFLDKKFNEQYFEDERLGKIFGAFALLAIFIASMGLYGMFSFSLKQKVKEIGIRKVLGARTVDLTHVLTRSYSRTFILAYAIALPVYLYLTNSWLENFTFRIETGWSIFWLPLALVALIFSLSIAPRLFSHVRSNPVNSLRCE